jgi:hypothetical protein
MHLSPTATASKYIILPAAGMSLSAHLIGRLRQARPAVAGQI